MVNVVIWGFLLIGCVFEDDQFGVVGVLCGVIKCLGELVICMVVLCVMCEMGCQFVLGEIIFKVMKCVEIFQVKGYIYFYDMFGEVVCIVEDVKDYFVVYSDVIDVIVKYSYVLVVENFGILVKLLVFYLCYEELQCDCVMNELVLLVLDFVCKVKVVNIGLNIDVEEVDCFVLLFDVIEVILVDLLLVGWDGFGVVVQVYG